MRERVEIFKLAEPMTETVAANIAPTVPSAAHNQEQCRIPYADENKLKFASRDNAGNWTVEVVDPAGGAMPSLAYDNLGNAHIAYAVGRTLKYAKRKE